jgi:hypothetical protein
MRIPAAPCTRGSTMRAAISPARSASSFASAAAARSAPWMPA